MGWSGQAKKPAMRHCATSDAAVRPVTPERRNHDPHRLGRRALLRVGHHLAGDAGIADGTVTPARRNRLDLITVAAVGLSGQVGRQTLTPGP